MKCFEVIDASAGHPGNFRLYWHKKTLLRAQTSVLSKERPLLKQFFYKPLLTDCLFCISFVQPNIARDWR